MKARDWLPDWRDENAYPDPETTSMKEWAWQFLRRNEEYQKDFYRMEKIIEKLDDSMAGSPNDSLDGHVCEPPALFGETLGEYRQRVRKTHGKNKIFGPTSVLRKKYQITFPHPPEAPTLFGFCRFNSTTGVPFSWYIKDFGTDQQSLAPSGPSEIVVKISLNRPLEPQIENIKYLCNKFFANRIPSELKRKKRKTKNRYDYLLRILDATSIGIKPAEIAKVLYPGEPNKYPNYYVSKRIYSQRTRAEHLRDQGYSEIAHL